VSAGLDSVYVFPLAKRAPVAIWASSAIRALLAMRASPARRRKKRGTVRTPLQTRSAFVVAAAPTFTSLSSQAPTLCSLLKLHGVPTSYA